MFDVGTRDALLAVGHHLSVFARHIEERRLQLGQAFLGLARLDQQGATKIVQASIAADPVSPEVAPTTVIRRPPRAST